MKKLINVQRPCISQSIAVESDKLWGKLQLLNITLEKYKESLKKSNKALELCIKRILQIKLKSNVNIKAKGRFPEIIPNITTFFTNQHRWE